MAHISIPASAKQNFPLWMRFMDEISSHIAYQRSFRLFILDLLLLVLLLLECVCMFFKFLNDNESNIIHIV